MILELGVTQPGTEWLIAFCQKHNLIKPEFVHDHGQFVTLRITVRTREQMIEIAEMYFPKGL